MDSIRREPPNRVGRASRHNALGCVSSRFARSTTREVGALGGWGSQGFRFRAGIQLRPAQSKTPAM